MSERPKAKCAVVEGPDGRILRVLPDRAAAGRWAEKHFPGGNPKIAEYRTFAAVGRAFDRQMQLGLTDTSVIYDLLAYGGVSTRWRPGGAGKRKKA